MLTVCMFLERERPWAFAASMAVNSLRRGSNGCPIQFVIGYSANADDEPDLIEPDLWVVPRKRFGHYPAFNKIRALDAASELTGGDCLLLDHDVIAGPRVTELIGARQPAFGAVENLKDQLRSTFGQAIDRVVLSHGGVQLGELRYFNSGVVSIGQAGLKDLARTWRRVAVGVFDDFLAGERPRPFGNLTLSLAVARLGIDAVSYPPAFNQRNYGELPDDPVIIHYNNWDPVNLRVKGELLAEPAAFKRFLGTTDNRFWTAYADLFLHLLEVPSVDATFDALWGAIAGAR